MLNLFDLSRIKGFRFPRSVIGYAVWAYHRFALSLRDVEDLLASRGIRVSYETVRDWVARAYFIPGDASQRGGSSGSGVSVSHVVTPGLSWTQVTACDVSSRRVLTTVQ